MISNVLYTYIIACVLIHPTRIENKSLYRPAPRTYATSSSEPNSTEDPAETRANELLDLANRALEDGDVHGAKALYEQSCTVKASPTAWYNLGVSG